VLDKPGDLAGILTSLENDVLFIDEIHRLSPVVEEYLYSAMEDYRIDIMIDKGPSARSIQIDLNPFTLVGATTRSGLLTAPLRARFGINMHLEYYDPETLQHIIKRSASILKVPIDDEAAAEICPALTRNAPYRQRPAAACARLCPGQRQRHASTTTIARMAPDSPQHRFLWSRRDRQQDSAHHHRQVPRRSRGCLYHRYGHRRGRRNRGGGLRALPHHGRLHQAYARAAAWSPRSPTITWAATLIEGNIMEPDIFG
jgi:hypothetical protein